MVPKLYMPRHRKCEQLEFGKVIMLLYHTAIESHEKGESNKCFLFLCDLIYLCYLKYSFVLFMIFIVIGILQLERIEKFPDLLSCFFSWSVPTWHHLKRLLAFWALENVRSRNQNKVMFYWHPIRGDKDL